MAPSPLFVVVTGDALGAPLLDAVAQRLRGSLVSGAAVSVDARPTPKCRPRGAVPAGATKDDPFVLRVDGNLHSAGAAGAYDHRYLLGPGVAKPDEVAQRVAEDALTSGSLPSVGGVAAAAAPRFVSTRGEAPAESFLGALREGLAADGGLFLPAGGRLPPLPPDTVEALLGGAQRKPTETEAAADGGASVGGPGRYLAVAQAILERLVDRREVPVARLAELLGRAYADDAWAVEERCPVTDATWWSPGEPGGGGVFLSEQFHGPTAAFKDFALQLFPLLFTDAAEAVGRRYMILAATSGDTGVAAIRGFVGLATPVMVLYPTHGVSPVQKAQMLSYDGGNVRVVGVERDFDFCQGCVKAVFSDGKLAAELAAINGAGLRLSSANSINWGRLLPQIVYYFHSYAELARQGRVAFPAPMDVVVPTGNFGNILACYLAKHLGLPIGRLVVASNENDVLFEFVETGVYDAANRQLRPTASPSIDILRASNIERFLFIATGGDAALVAGLMRDLDATGRFEAPASVCEELRAGFAAYRCTEAECRAAIQRAAAGRAAKILDPHTAVAMHAAHRYVEEGRLEEGRPLLVASTAHWAKFPGPVLAALTGAAGDSATAANAATTDDVRQQYRAVLERAPAGTEIAAPLAAVFGVTPTGLPLEGRVAEAKSATRSVAAELPLVVAELKKFVAEQTATRQ